MSEENEPEPEAPATLDEIAAAIRDDAERYWNGETEGDDE